MEAHHWAKDSADKHPYATTQSWMGSSLSVQVQVFKKERDQKRPLHNWGFSYHIEGETGFRQCSVEEHKKALFIQEYHNFQ